MSNFYPANVYPVYDQVQLSSCAVQNHQGTTFPVPEIPYTQMQQESFRFPAENLEFPSITDHFSHAAVSTSTPYSNQSGPELRPILDFLEDRTSTAPSTVQISQDWSFIEEFLSELDSAPTSSAANGSNTCPRPEFSNSQEYRIDSTSASPAPTSSAANSTSQRPEFSANPQHIAFQDSTPTASTSSSNDSGYPSGLSASTCPSEPSTISSSKKRKRSSDKPGPISSSKKRKGSSDKPGPNNAPLNKNAVAILKHWYQESGEKPFPTKEEKHDLVAAAEGSITVDQVSTWFGNKRSRCHTTKSQKGKRELEEKLLAFCEKVLKKEAEESQTVQDDYILDNITQIIDQQMQLVM